eukprot:CAMPEP_0183361964 /NCGR_PEP_ID=MMETSP0164_2-20130417/65377_1 /TAXON_ID=221442 /ORGANISM="Coccolithus pelagicus ssp braarudi, Strain PLY182g" /LENGTH=55 /DNA_ID=CAMNT_0025536697 /DNA_START=64 /DNA_END=227 /DNA_ORIENTATION=-
MGGVRDYVLLGEVLEGSSPSGSCIHHTSCIHHPTPHKRHHPVLLQGTILEMLGTA